MWKKKSRSYYVVKMEKNIHQENPEKKNPGISIRKKIMGADPV